MLTVGDTFPQFSCQACVGTGKDDMKVLTNADHAGKWVVYFFYPKDFTFVCPTELAEFNKQLKAFADRDTMLVGGSTDNEWSHLAWRRAHADLTNLGYPLIAAQKLAPELGILEKTEGYCLRATFIVDPHGVIQWVDVNGGRVIPGDVIEFRVRVDKRGPAPSVVTAVATEPSWSLLMPAASTTTTSSARASSPFSPRFGHWEPSAVHRAVPSRQTRARAE
jgi:peroxiredoxin (alkyl hydroperoxide reductase subunit C)